MLNETLQIISMVLCLVGFMQVLAGPKMEKIAVGFYSAFYITMFLYSAVILTSLELEGNRGENITHILRITVFLELLIGYILTSIVVGWLLYLVDKERNNREIKNVQKGSYGDVSRSDGGNAGFSVYGLFLQVRQHESISPQ